MRCYHYVVITVLLTTVMIDVEVILDVGIDPLGGQR